MSSMAWLITFLPASFHIHPKLDAFVKKRRDTLAKDGLVDWAFAEAIAFGDAFAREPRFRASRMNQLME